MIRVFLLVAAMAIAPVCAHAQSQAAPTSNQTTVQSPASTHAQPATTQPSSSNNSQANTSSADRAHDNPAAPPTGNQRSGIKPTNAEDTGDGGQLPQTSTILPLLGLIGLGSLVAGLFARR